MTDFEKELIAQREYQARCYAAGARNAARRGCPEHAATLRKRAAFAARLAEDARQAAEWRHQSEDERPPL